MGTGEPGAPTEGFNINKYLQHSMNQKLQYSQYTQIISIIWFQLIP